MIKHVRETTLARGKTEKLLSIYIDEQTSKSMPVDSNILHEIAKCYYEKLNKNQDVGTFSASKGWFICTVSFYYLSYIIHVLYILSLYHVFRGLLGEKRVNLRSPRIH